MQSSVVILLSALAFMVFGYLSVLRFLQGSLHPAGNEADQSRARWHQLFGQQFLSNLGTSAFFVSLPATSLLLYWGWGPAIIWLLVFHLLIESLVQIRFSATANTLGIADHLLRNSHRGKAILEQGLIQAFFLLSMALVTALLATLIDRQSGLLFAILLLFAARAMWRNTNAALPHWFRISSALALLCLGLAFSDQLGFSIYGDWAPLGESLSWLRFHNPTVIALVLVIAVFRMELNPGFQQDLSSFAGGIISLLVLSMLVLLLVTAPPIDAPMNSAVESGSNKPSFILLGLFIVTGFSALLVRLLNEEDNHTKRGGTQLWRLQSSSIVQLLFMVLLTLALAAALGIGAWKSQYLVWDSDLNLLEHLNFGISATLVLLGSEADSGSLLHTILLAALCFAGFSFMLNCANQLTLEEQEHPSFWSIVVESKILQAALIFISSCYFIDAGIGLHSWLLIGGLAWALVTHLLVSLCLHFTKAGFGAQALRVLCFGLIATGLVQGIILALGWLVSGSLVSGGALLILVIALIWLWLPDLLKLSQQRSSEETESLF